MKVTKSKLVIFSIAIAFVSVFFFAYVIQAFYPAPQYEDFCGEDVFAKIPGNESSCVDGGGRWTPYEKVEMNVSGWCDPGFYCRQEYDVIRGIYERNVFFINLGLGIIVFVVALFLAIEAVSSGLMGGAVMLIVYGSIRYWGELSNAWRALMLGFALVILITIGYKKLKN